jgi:aerobic carbon-monoxide dehydrogenase large subunit
MQPSLGPTIVRAGSEAPTVAYYWAVSQSCFASRELVPAYHPTEQPDPRSEGYADVLDTPMQLTKFGTSHPPRRLEDESLIRGQGRFLANAVPRDAMRMMLVRSPHARAQFQIGDLTTLTAMPGVRDVLTWREISHLSPLPCHAEVKNKDGRPIGIALRPILPSDTVQHVGQVIAAVVAESEQAARDAVDLFPVRWEALPAVVSMNESLAPGAPGLHPHLSSNLVYEVHMGDIAATERAFAHAHKVVGIDLVNQRVVANFLETRGAIGEWDALNGRYTLVVSSQGVHAIRRDLCEHVFKIPETRMRVISGDVGGGFGTKISAYPEYALALVAAERSGVTVAWIGDRTEHFIGDSQGRDHISSAKLALDDAGHILALQIKTVANVGSFAAHYGPATPNFAARILGATYRIPAISISLRTAYTNTLPVDAYRGAGRPEAAYLVERLVDTAASELGVSPDEFRARNFIRSTEMPYRTVTGCTYDSGDFEGQMRQALQAAGQDSFLQRRKLSEREGKIRGLGFATYIEFCALGAEDAEARLEKDGTLSVRVGTQASGQGHVTAFCQLIAERFRLPLDRIKIIQGDTDLVASGGGTSGSRTITLGGMSVWLAALKLAQQLKEVGADLLEVSAGDLQFENGRLVVAGTDRSIELAELASNPKAPDERRTAKATFAQTEPTYPNGTHVCEVEIDPETGLVEIQGYWVVDDFGNVINAPLLQGQVHGGIAQGIGQALFERAVYDTEGQLLTSSFMDYAMPRAAQLPSFFFQTRNIPCATNPLGLKGAGEAGTIGACPAVMNAILNALRSVGFIGQVDMPASSERIWKALQGLPFESDKRRLCAR